MNEEIKVVIGRSGEIVIHVEGASGSRCLSLTETLERDLGRVVGRRRTGAYYEPARIHNPQHIGCRLVGRDPTDG